MNTMCPCILICIFIYIYIYINKPENSTSIVDEFRHNRQKIKSTNIIKFGYVEICKDKLSPD
jgi:hypothetical protein